MTNEKHTLAAAAFLITSTLAAPSNALSLAEQAEAFATCAGRYSAMATRQSATHNPDSDATRALQSSFESLLEAMLPHAAEAGIDPRRARSWQASGWSEMAQLMRLQQRSADATHADRASRDMHRRLSTCRQLIL
ncbi:hypothetical protein FIU89_07850 [Roseovarius sp. THAF27]|uniref:hypothetical protein n=1 Tax=unclassified Roseovarius TaxID=2614913 RepID=UPI001269369B|nr:MULTISPECIES: hypothetical protein [unclassified Roseovarius]QFT80521.1 hypothetical protein FIU89_07850 [Roseovarius sp. THAF27]QFT96351.1 hypothetical protein FIU85_03465 [Roseovarius sp. THAF8]